MATRYTIRLWVGKRIAKYNHDNGYTEFFPAMNSTSAITTPQSVGQ